VIEALVDAALAEDVGAGDVTAEATVPAEARGVATITQKAPGVISGLDVAQAVFARLDPDATFERGPEGEWFNNHFHKGYPRHWPAAEEQRVVPAVTGAALCVRRDAFEAVGGFTTDYVVGDYEDSDLCLKLRALGGDIAYVPRAELYHFERQSIRDHAGYARTLASVYNRRLHHRRWAAAIEQLMARTERRAARGGR